MKISGTFKGMIASHFYDKKVDVYEKVKGSRNEYGEIVSEKIKFVESLDCNVREITNDVAEKEYGIVIDADILITTSGIHFDISEASYIVKWNNRFYDVKKTPSFDSHVKIYAKEDKDVKEL